jgi:hypothetical protein
MTTNAKIIMAALLMLAGGFDLGYITHAHYPGSAPIAAFAVIRGDSKSVIITYADGKQDHFTGVQITPELIQRLMKDIQTDHLGVLTIPPCGADDDDHKTIVNSCTTQSFAEKYPYLGHNTRCITVKI